MHKIIFDMIEKYDRIIIHRHKNPDGDAYGAQLGLKRLIELNYPDKDVYAVGDTNNFVFLGDMDIITDEVYHGALAIIVDVCVTSLISDDRYTLAEEVLVIDHHLNQPDFTCEAVIESSRIACSELITHEMMEREFQFDHLAATRLLTGIVTDSGRFRYPSTGPETLEMAAYLIRQGADMNWIYKQLYTEELNFKKLRGYFIEHFQLTEHKVAYMMNTKDLKDKFGVSTFVVSRAMVNQMSNIEGVDIWSNFTEDDDGSILVELRSANDSIVHIARKYGGGGHARACGCTVESFAQAHELLHDLDTFIESREHNG
ncbi:DHH family phosphoesterase [Candidatus Xianfuyuplasma coldseepsis]|uniref:Bifunctional oligoribonuclease/PAP phosphatase NrnA n=1 Tax=Candidatus Xianfuyuplasma coldseepsis TaxID=2782163 RepID=A0A7L7KRV0_9MOLU|nr:bifunctional oligoribonuclease/PAP phosphatase NrnA [Xianfuyuplasma coldseepsis]QMS84982.1 bifunctional oligoribonuclease/PAP phosphatase NrnA [Xianfuyuplasma coldseepsis]